MIWAPSSHSSCTYSQNKPFLQNVAEELTALLGGIEFPSRPPMSPERRRMSIVRSMTCGVCRTMMTSRRHPENDLIVGSFPEYRSDNSDILCISPLDFNGPDPL